MGKTNRRSRNVVDEATAAVITAMLHSAGLSNLAADKASGSAIGYNRIRDIKERLKAPARMSEFLIICEVCHADPVEKLREIIRLTHQIEAERAQTGTSDEVDIDSWADRIRSEESVPQGE